MKWEEFIFGMAIGELIMFLISGGTFFGDGSLTTEMITPEEHTQCLTELEDIKQTPYYQELDRLRHEVNKKYVLVFTSIIASSLCLVVFGFFQYHVINKLQAKSIRELNEQLTKTKDSLSQSEYDLDQIKETNKKLLKGIKSKKWKVDIRW